MKNFAIIGAAGYIAPRHMKAIKETGNNLVCALDPYDGIGIMDSYFPEAAFFTEPERFDRHLDKLRRQGDKRVEYVTVCSPNYLHDAHIRMALRNDCHVICEKPLVSNPWNIDALAEIERETGKRINAILQLRLHPAIIALKKKIENAPEEKIYNIDLTYITSRGSWYHHSWKGDISKSGGIATNIGVHFFDMLTWIFGKVIENVVHVNQSDRASGFLQLKKARINWFLSINHDTLPKEIKSQKQTTYRMITIDGEAIEFSDGFADLHTMSYQHILENKGFGLNDVRPSIEIVHSIRNMKLVPASDEFNRFLNSHE
jgi:UDP-N-acetyl-2-amino-2-deoxyglucuronate dehydrogenase